MIYEWVIFLLVYWRVFSEMDNRKYILNHPNSRWKKWKSSSSAQMETKNMKETTKKKRDHLGVLFWINDGQTLSELKYSKINNPDVHLFAFNIL